MEPKLIPGHGLKDGVIKKREQVTGVNELTIVNEF